MCSYSIQIYIGELNSSLTDATFSAKVELASSQPPWNLPSSLQVRYTRQNYAKLVCCAHSPNFNPQSHCRQMENNVWPTLIWHKAPFTLCTVHQSDRRSSPLKCVDNATKATLFRHVENKYWIYRMFRRSTSMCRLSQVECVSTRLVL